MGFWGKKNFQLGLRSVMSITYFSFFLLFFFKYYYFIDDLTFFLPFSIRSVIRSVIRSAIRSIIRSVIRSVIRDPIRPDPDFIDAVTPLPAQENQLCNFFFQTLIFPNYTPPLFPNKESSSWSGKPSYFILTSTRSKRCTDL